MLGIRRLWEATQINHQKALRCSDLNWLFSDVYTYECRKYVYTYVCMYMHALYVCTCIYVRKIVRMPNVSVLCCTIGPECVGTVRMKGDDCWTYVADRTTFWTT